MSETPETPNLPKKPVNNAPVGMMEMWIRLPKPRERMTIIILALTVGVYGLQLLSQAIYQMDIPLGVLALDAELIQQGQFWRLLTVVLVHGSILHIGLNMLAFYTLGRSLERFYGPWRLLILYLLGALGGSLFQYYFSQGVAAGAATGVFAIAAGQLVLFLRNRFLWEQQNRNYLLNFMGILGLNLIINLFPGLGGLSMIGGFLAGLGFAWFAGPRYHLSMVGENSQEFELVDQVEPRTTIQTMAVALLVIAGLIALRFFSAG